MIEVISKLYAKEEKTEELISVFSEMAKLTKKEKGYIMYEMYQDNDKPSTLLVVEQWETMKDFNNHCTSEYFNKTFPHMKECMEKESEINICTKVA